MLRTRIPRVLGWRPLWALILFICLAGPLWQVMEGTAWAMSIRSPTGGDILRAGMPAPVSVSVGKDLNVRVVRYYWYRMDEEPQPSHHATAAPFTAAKGTPFTGTVLVPAEALGTMRLLAVGEVAGGRLESHEEFDEVLVKVETDALLDAIGFTVEKPWRFDQIGKRVVIPAVGQFNDGIVRPLWGPNTGSRFRSSNERVVSIDATGVMQVMGPGRAAVTVENRGKIGSLDIVVEFDGEANRSPIAEVPAEIRVKSGDLVVLDGLRSRDPDGDLLHYEWKQTLGHRVNLSNVNEAKATFVAPKVSERKRYQFSLIVTDMAGPDTVKGADSRPATVTVWVVP